MLNYEKWKKLNETLGPTTLGISSPKSLGITGAQFSQPEVLAEDEDMEDESDEDEDMEYESEDDDHHHHKHHHHHHHHHADDEMMDDEEDMDDEMMDDEEDMDDEMMDDEEDMDDEMMDDEEDMDDEMMDDEEDMDDEMMDDEEDDDEEEDDMDDEEIEDAEYGMSDGEDDDEMGDDEVMDMEFDMDVEESKKTKGAMLSEKEWWESVNSMIGHMAPNGKIISEDKKVMPEMKDEKKSMVSGKAGQAVSRFENVLKENDVKNISKTKVKALINELIDHILKYNTTMTKQNLKDLFKQVVNDYTQGKK